MSETSKQARVLHVAMDVLHEFGALRLKVTGTSMMPSIWPGDVVTIDKPGPAAIAPGDIVVVRADDGLRVHRAVRIDSAHGLVTRGDALTSDDPAVSADRVVGRVTSISRWGLQLDPGAAGTRMWRPVAPLISAAAWLKWSLFRRRLGERRPHTQGAA